MLSPQERIPLKRVPALVGRTYLTVINWVRTGVHGVKLRSELIGGRRFTCQAWLDDFHARVNATSPIKAEEPAHVA